MAEVSNSTSGDPIGDVSLKATQDLSEGAAVIYARLRQLERDFLGVSDEAAALAAYAALAGSPMISPPSAFGQPDEAAVSSTSPIKRAKGMSLHESKLASEILEAWATSVHEAGQKRHDLENSPIYRAQEAYWREFRNGEHPSAYTAANSVVATLSIGAVFIAFVGATGRRDSHIAYNAISDSVQQVTPTIPGPGDMRAELGLIAATIAYGAVFQAAWMTVGESAKTQPKGNQLNLQFATNYANRLIVQSKDRAFNVMLATLTAEHMGTKNLTAEKIQEMITMVKLGMMLSAAALFYQVDTGGQSGLEVAAYLRPDAPPLDPKNPRAKLIAEMHDLLSVLKRESREQVLVNMLAYLDEHKSVKSLTDPFTILQGIFGGDASLSAEMGAIVAA